jgi:hypothetical protein
LPTWNKGLLKSSALTKTIWRKNEEKGDADQSSVSPH